MCSPFVPNTALRWGWPDDSSLLKCWPMARISLFAVACAWGHIRAHSNLSVNTVKDCHATYLYQEQCRSLAHCAFWKKGIFRMSLWRISEVMKGKAKECYTWYTNWCHMNISWRLCHAMRKPRTKPDLWLLWRHLLVLEQAGQFAELPSCHILKLTSASYQSYQGHWDWLITAGPHSIPEHLWYKVYGRRKRNRH